MKSIVMILTILTLCELSFADDGVQIDLHPYHNSGVDEVQIQDPLGNVFRNFSTENKFMYENELAYLVWEDEHLTSYPIAVSDGLVPLSELDKANIGSLLCDSGVGTVAQTITLQEFYERQGVLTPSILKVYNPILDELMTVFDVKTVVLSVVGCSN